MVEISPEWVTDPEQGKSSGRVATISLWTGLFRDLTQTLNTLILLYFRNDLDNHTLLNLENDPLA